MRFSIADLLTVSILISLCVVLNAKEFAGEKVQQGAWVHCSAEYGFPFEYKTIWKVPAVLVDEFGAPLPSDMGLGQAPAPPASEPLFHLWGTLGNVAFWLIVGINVFVVRRALFG